MDVYLQILVMIYPVVDQFFVLIQFISSENYVMGLSHVMLVFFNYVKRILFVGNDVKVRYKYDWEVR